MNTIKIDDKRTKMMANYHTHTHRCHHGYGCEWEYIERAIEGGLQELGFSDHNPWPGDATCPKVRMKTAQLNEYTDTIEYLRRIYGERITLRIGLEVEYFPDEFEGLMDLLKKNGKVEYLILGQHYHPDDKKRPSGHVFRDKKRLKKWVDVMIEAFQTGKFLYVAHPDIANFKGSPFFYKKEMRRLCRAANECGLPLEINGQGLRAKSHYPQARFWRIAGKEGCKVVIGMDAHKPSGICNSGEIHALLAIAKRHKLEVLDKLEIKGIL